MSGGTARRLPLFRALRKCEPLERARLACTFRTTKIGTVRSTRKSPLATDDHHMTSIAPTEAEPGSPTLRFVSEPPAEREGASPILIAGRDRVSRAEVLDSLAETMGPDAAFEEAETFSGVLLKAPASRLVVLAGELDGVPPESLRDRLARRHPDLPVATLDARAQRTGAGIRS